jgi:ABC-2 type transport system ATP-binding protein
MFAVEVDQISKTYTGRPVVRDLSFAVSQGEVCGLIGPNGAGKTTTIRIMMDIIKPDSGHITIFGHKLSEDSKNHLGYLPEERGLYRKMKVLDSIIYLASLKGMEPRSAAEKAEELLDRTGMLSSRDKKIDELSKGMGQIIQFIITILHNPQLIILDEPFSGLDPVNTEMLKKMLLDLRSQGKAIILSTHQMNQVEELCDRILMVNNGAAVLYGSLQDIKSQYRSNRVLLDYTGEMGELPGVIVKHLHQGSLELVLDAGTSPQQLLAHLVNRGIIINRFEVAAPSLNEIFLKVAGKRNE